MSHRKPDRSEQFYRLLLRLYPREFRNEFGDEMVICFRDTRRGVTGVSAFARLWVETVFDLLSSALRENWQSLHRLMNPKNHPTSPLLRFIVSFPFGSAFAVLALATVVGLGFQLKTKDFSPAAYFLVMLQVTVLSLVILISGFLVDIENRCLRLLGREIRPLALIACTIGIALMGVGVYRLQYLNLTIEQLLPLVLQIMTCGTIWVQVVMLNEIRLRYREIRSANLGNTSAATSQSATPA